MLLVPHVTVDHVLTHREPSHVIVLEQDLRETRVRMVYMVYLNFSINFKYHLLCVCQLMKVIIVSEH